MAEKIQPATQAFPAKYADLHQWPCDCLMCIRGPGGKTTNIENNERGILTQALQGIIKYHEEAALGSDHDSHKQGIYASNELRPDND
jgi:hypothetical protein